MAKKYDEILESAPKGHEVPNIGKMYYKLKYVNLGTTMLVFKI